MTEKYIQCRDFPNYSVSDYGNVRNNKTGKVLIQSMSQGYRSISPILKGKNKTVRVHILVAKEHCEGFELGLHVNHKDLNKLNNLAINLEWVTPLQNVRHAINLGVNSFNRENRPRKLDDMQILTMLTLSNSVKSIQLCNTFEVARNFLINIRKGTSRPYLSEIAREMYATR